VSKGQQPQDAETTEHFEEIEMMSVFGTSDAQHKCDPEREHGNKVHAVERMAQKGSSCQLQALLVLNRLWARLLPLHQGRERSGKRRGLWLSRANSFHGPLSLRLEYGLVSICNCCPDPPFAINGTILLCIQNEARHHDPGEYL
jgi:hypothetical protein